MKLYSIEYDFVIMNIITGEEKNLEHRIEMFYDVGEFIARTETLNKHNTTLCGKKYIHNLKLYSGHCNELDIENVLNPF